MKEERDVATVGCFGKLPDRGDFFRFRQHQPAAMAFDTWVRHGMHVARKRLAADFREAYSRAAPYRFQLTPASSGQTLAGVIAFSRDRHGREYPLVCFATSAQVGGGEASMRIVDASAFFHVAEALLVEAVRGLPASELSAALGGLGAYLVPGRATQRAFRAFLGNTPVSTRWSTSVLLEAVAAVAARRRSVPRLWQWGIQIPLDGGEAEIEWEVAFWTQFLVNLGGARSLQPALFWTTRSGEGQRPELWCFFREPSPRLLGAFIGGIMTDLDVVTPGRGHIGEPRLDPHVVQLANPDLTLGQVLDVSFHIGRGPRSRVRAGH